MPKLLESALKILGIIIFLKMHFNLFYHYKAEFDQSRKTGFFFLPLYLFAIELMH